METMLKNSLLSAENITKSYLSGDSKLMVLKGVTFNIYAGEIAVLLGASGSGKSTLLNILAGIDMPDEGKVILEGEELTQYNDDQLADKRNMDIGFVFQFHHLLGDFTVLENIMLPALIGGTQPDSARKKALELLEVVGLSDRAKHKPGEISGGEAQRVAVARALVNDPKLVLADEPTGNLDAKNGHKLLGLLFDLNRERNLTFFIATHNRELTKGPRRLNLVEGRIYEN